LSCKLARKNVLLCPSKAIFGEGKNLNTPSLTHSKTKKPSKTKTTPKPKNVRKMGLRRRMWESVEKKMPEEQISFLAVYKVA